MKQLVFLLGVLGVAAYVILRPIVPALGRQNGAGNSMSEGQLRSELAELRRAIDETNRIARSAQGGVATLKEHEVAAARRNQPSDKARPGSNDPTPDGPAIAEEEPPTREQRVANLEADFATESYEHAWASWAKDRVTRLLNSNDESASVQSIDCRASMCRVETSHESLELYRQYMFTGFSGEHEWPGPRTTTLISDEPGAPIRSVTFLLRSNSDGT